MKYWLVGKYFLLTVMTVLLHVQTFAYTPWSWDVAAMDKVDNALETIKETWWKERLAYFFFIITERAETISDDRSKYLLEYVLHAIAQVMETDFGVTMERTPILVWADFSEDIRSSVGEYAWTTSSVTTDDTLENESGNQFVSDTSSVAEGDTINSRSLQDFYDTYKWLVTSDVPISDLCTTYFDKIDAVAKEYDFPTSVIIATWYREHTCKFSNPANAWGNFQITSHSYPPGNISWADFEDQIINFIIFSRAKRAWYNTFQKFWPEPVTLTYDSIDLTSLRKQAILYNGVVGTLENNIYANQNFWQAASGRDGIVAMTIRALGWQLENTRDISWVVINNEVSDVIEEDIEEVSEADTKNEESTTAWSTSICDDVFTENLGKDANHPQVLAMQKFLQEEGLYSGEPNGIFDDKSVEAVNAFQAFYKEDILTPGGYTSPTWAWYPATRRKANSIVCE